MISSAWLELLDSNEACLGRFYGDEPALRRSARELWCATLRAFTERFGERDVRLFRSPGRINLRGMHVDTHGGYLNLMTHQRETVVVAGLSGDASTTAINTEPGFPEVSFSVQELERVPAFRKSWNEYIVSPPVRRRVSKNAGSWGNYVEGCALNVQHRLRDATIPGLSLTVGSNLPRGAALSSSAALCTSVVLAFSEWSHRSLVRDELILAARDAEWYAGSRCGVSDQAAMVLGAPGRCTSVALHPARFNTSSARSYPLPEEVGILVVDSRTERSLSGKALIDYTRNRFAYSIALHVCRQELATMGIAEDALTETDSLPALAPNSWPDRDGLALVYRILLSIPETVTLGALRERYHVPDLDSLYHQHFGNVPDRERPDQFRLRGPLLFGIAESERARLFPDAVAQGDWTRAGRLMCTGHDGDRLFCADGTPYLFDTSDRVLEGLAEGEVAVEECPGAYGASTRALDYLVDSALAAGACGASLTGAGLAGSVVALCPSALMERIATALRQKIASVEYATIAGGSEPFSQQEAERSVIANRAIAGAGEMQL